MLKNTLFAGICTALVFTGCANLPSGPSVMALPGTGLSFEQFRQDDYLCQQYATSQLGTTPNQAGADSQLGSAVAGTIVGSGESGRSGYATQQGYDHAYVQCMYGKGHRVPVSGQFSYQSVPTGAPAARIPPPPPGSPPPPPYQ